MKEKSTLFRTNSKEDRKLSGEIRLEVPTADDVDSSTSEKSSPETPPEQEQKIEQKQKKQKKKKNLQPRIIRSPASDSLFCNEDDVFKSKDKDGKRMQQALDLSIPRVEKTSSFRRKQRPENLERLVKDFNENKENKRSSVRSDSKGDRMMEYNIVLLGDLGVGKTALAVRFVTRRYLHEYDPILERSYEKAIQCSGEQVMVRLWDTVSKNWENYTEIVDGFLVMYSVTSSHSATNAQNIINSITSSPTMKNVPILLAANKRELEHARKVSKEETEEFAIIHKCSFTEISIATTTNVDGVIKMLIKQIQAQEGGRMTPSLLPNDGHQKLTASTSLSRKPSNAKHIMKNFLSKKKEKT